MCVAELSTVSSPSLVPRLYTCARTQTSARVKPGNEASHVVY